MGDTKNDHCVLRNKNFLCTNCGGTKKIDYPIGLGVFIIMSNHFSDKHKNCPKTWEEPQIDPAISITREKANWWMRNGERGVSSETIWQTLDDRGISLTLPNHPLDPSDFKRCYLLLKAIPEWKLKLYLMKEVSPVWSRLVDNWDKLTEMLEEELSTKVSNGIKMYTFMKELGC